MTTAADSNRQANQTNQDEHPSMTIPQQPKRSISNLAVRIITGLVLLPGILFVTFASGWWLTISALILISIGTIEFYHMEKQRGLPGNTLLGLATAIAVVLALAGTRP